jgi:hypothetical protein
MTNEQTEFFTYRDAMEKVDNLLASAEFERGQALKYGGDVTSGDSGIPCFRLAAQYIAEAQVWATVALAATNRTREAIEVGL